MFIRTKASLSCAIFIDPLSIQTQRRWTSAYINDPMHAKRERELFIGTQCSNLYTLVDTPAKGRVGGGGVFVITCKYVLGQPQVS